MSQARIVPSILSSDFGNIREEVKAVVDAGCRLVHLDVMDGNFVPAITFGHATVSMLRESFDIPFDVHLMVRDPEAKLDLFANALGSGSDSPGFRDGEDNIITVHQEVCPHLHRTIEKIRTYPHMKAGVALNPGTPVSSLEAVFKDIDMVLLMTVDPGAGGQPIIEDALDKISQVRELEEKKDHKVLIELDGGIKPGNLDKTRDADLLVMGSAVYSDKNPETAAANFIKVQKKLDQIRLALLGKCVR
jgi:ribulose-phosphate 3-epimerase